MHRSSGGGPKRKTTGPRSKKGKEKVSNDEEMSMGDDSDEEQMDIDRDKESEASGSDEEEIMLVDKRKKKKPRKRKRSDDEEMNDRGSFEFIDDTGVSSPANKISARSRELPEQVPIDKRSLLTTLSRSVSGVDLNTTQIIPFKEEFPSFIRYLCKKDLFDVIDLCVLVQKNLAKCLSDHPNNQREFKINFPVWSPSSDYFLTNHNIKQELATDIFNMIKYPDRDKITSIGMLLESCLLLMNKLSGLVKQARSASQVDNGVAILKWIDSISTILHIWDKMKRIRIEEADENMGAGDSLENIDRNFINNIKTSLFTDRYKTKEEASEEWHDHVLSRGEAYMEAAGVGDDKPKPANTYLYRQFLGLNAPVNKDIRPIIWAIQEAGVIATNVFMYHLCEDVIIDEYINKQILSLDMGEREISIVKSEWDRLTKRIYTSDEPSTLSTSKRLRLEAGFNDFWISASSGYIDQKGMNSVASVLPNGNAWVWRSPNNTFINYFQSLRDKISEGNPKYFQGKSRSVQRLLSKDNPLIINDLCKDKNESLLAYFLIDKLEYELNREENENFLDHWRDSMLNKHGAFVDRLDQDLFKDEVMELSQQAMKLPSGNKIKDKKEYRKKLDLYGSCIKWRDTELVEKVTILKSKILDAVKNKQNDDLIKHALELKELHSEYIPRFELTTKIRTFCIKVASIFDDIYGFDLNNIDISFSYFMSILLEDFISLSDAIKCIEGQIGTLQSKKKSDIDASIKDLDYKKDRDRQKMIYIIGDKLKISIDDISKEYGNDLIAFLEATRHAHLNLDCALEYSRRLLEKIISDANIFGLKGSKSINTVFPNRENALRDYRLLLKTAKDRISQSPISATVGGLWWNTEKFNLLRPLINELDSKYSTDFVSLLNQINILIEEYVDIAYIPISSNENVLVDYKNVLDNFKVTDFNVDEKVKTGVWEIGTSCRSKLHKTKQIPGYQLNVFDIKNKLTFDFICNLGGGNQNNFSIRFSRRYASPDVIDLALNHQHFLDLNTTFNHLISESIIIGSNARDDKGILDKIDTPHLSIGSSILYVLAGAMATAALISYGLSMEYIETSKNAFLGKWLYATNWYNNASKANIIGSDVAYLKILADKFNTTPDALIKSSRAPNTVSWLITSLFINPEKQFYNALKFTADGKPELYKAYLGGLFTSVIDPKAGELQAGRWLLPSTIKTGIIVNTIGMLISSGIILVRLVKGAIDSKGDLKQFYRNLSRNENDGPEEQRKKDSWIYSNFADSLILYTFFTTISSILITTINYKFGGGIVDNVSNYYVIAAILDRIIGIGFSNNKNKLGTLIQSGFGLFNANPLVGLASSVLTTTAIGWFTVSSLTNPTLMAAIFGAVSIFLVVGARLYQSGVSKNETFHAVNTIISSSMKLSTVIGTFGMIPAILLDIFG